MGERCMKKIDKSEIEGIKKKREKAIKEKQIVKK